MSLFQTNGGREENPAIQGPPWRSSSHHRPPGPPPLLPSLCPSPLSFSLSRFFLFSLLWSFKVLHGPPATTISLYHLPLLPSTLSLFLFAILPIPFSLSLYCVGLGLSQNGTGVYQTVPSVSWLVWALILASEPCSKPFGIKTRMFKMADELGRERKGTCLANTY